MLIFAFALALADPVPPAAPVEAAPPATPTQTAADPDELICRKKLDEAKSWGHIRKFYKVCKTREEWNGAKAS